MNRAVFLDRDGVVTQDPPHFAHRLDQLKLIPRAVDAIKLLNENEFKVVVVSNQSGVAKGYFQEKDVRIFNRALEEELKKNGSYIDAIYYCPHHSEAKISAYRVDCDCRKPKPGMLLKAAIEMNINLKKSFMIGDKWSDILAGHAVGCKTIMVLTGHGGEQLSKNKLGVDFISGDLYEAVKNVVLNNREKSPRLEQRINTKECKMKSIKKIIGTLYWKFYLVTLNLLGFIILLFLYIIKPFKFVKLLIMVHGRIGHLAANTDLFLRRLQLKRKEKKERVFYLGLSGKPVNQQLLTMFKRKLPIIQNDHAHRLVNNSLLKKSPFYEPLPFMTNEYYEFNNTKPNLYFTASEEKKGKKLLKKMGIDDNSWFVCFHSRDPTYLDKLHGYYRRQQWSYHDYRDCSVENFMKAAEYIASQGGFAVRMGYVVAEKLPYSNNSRIIDYASQYRSDFGDIYLPAKCKFFLGTTAGLYLVPTIFNVPVAGTNFIHFHTPLGKSDLFIPKKIWFIKKKRFLTFREILDSEVARYQTSEQYAKAGLKVVENTAEEILDLAIEMNERLDGKFKTTEEDEELQEKFRSLLKPHHWCYGTPARIGAKFLRQNRELLE